MEKKLPKTMTRRIAETPLSIRATLVSEPDVSSYKLWRVYGWNHEKRTGPRFIGWVWMIDHDTPKIQAGFYWDPWHKDSRLNNTDMNPAWRRNSLRSAMTLAAKHALLKFYNGV